MKIPFQIRLFLSLLTAFAATPLSADDLGRLFFTPSQRQILDKLRYQPAKQKLPEVVIDQEPAEPELKPVIGGIYVNGLVYRKNGKSTAWVNQANTSQGDLGHRYLEIDADAISPDEVEILIPSANKSVKLKVGELYEPESANQNSSPDR